MPRLIVTTNLSLDGVNQDPAGDEGFRHGGWFDEMNDATRGAWAEIGLAEAVEADGILFGRHSYDFFAARWPQREGAWADRLRAVPKYVVSTQLREPEWVNTTVIGADDVAGLDGDIVVYASAQLVGTLLEQDLVDELRVLTFPVVLGDGRRLFSALPDQRRFRLLATEQVGDSIVRSTYERAR